jgi:hypothetical protein
MDKRTGLKMLEYLNLKYSDEIKPEPENREMTTREEIAKYQNKIKEHFSA